MSKALAFCLWAYPVIWAIAFGKMPYSRPIIEQALIALFVAVFFDGIIYCGFRAIGALIS